jgi:hypothetical protein
MGRFGTTSGHEMVWEVDDLANLASDNDPVIAKTVGTNGRISAHLLDHACRIETLPSV